MHIISTGTMVIIAGTIYKRFHTFKGAIVSLVAGIIGMVLIMIPLNLSLQQGF